MTRRLWWACVLALAICVSVVCVTPPSHAQSWQSDPRMAYEKNIEDRVADHENNAAEYRKFNNQRFEELNTKVTKNTAALSPLEDMARTIAQFERVFWWAFTGSFVTLLSACGIVWRAGWKYCPRAWAACKERLDLITHLHECMDKTQAVVEDNAERSERWRVAADEQFARIRDSLHRQGNAIHGTHGIIETLSEVQRRMEVIERDRLLAIEVKERLTAKVG